MSLINDALKRATRNQPTAASTPAAEPTVPMQPVEYRRRGLPWYFIPAVLAVIAAACWFIVKGVQARRESSSPVPKPIMLQARQPEPQSAAPNPASNAGVESSPATPAKPASTPPTAASSNISVQSGPPPTEVPPTPPTPAPAPPPEPPKPAYKLQGIFFRPANPSALVNGKSVWIGSRIDGATVKAITRDSLTLEADGQTTVLTLH